MSRGVTDWGYYRAVLRLTSTTCSNNPPPIISLITILKTLVKRCIFIMSRHRYVRNLDVDGTQFPSSNPPPPRAQRSAEERDDGALSDGGDDITPEQYGM
jgi:hypothetical protein